MWMQIAWLPGALLLLAGWASTGTAGTGTPDCHGKPATQIGTPGNDRIIVRDDNAVVVARDGDDRIEVYGDSATVCGGKDLDGIGPFAGSRGLDRFFGNRGRDCIGKPGCAVSHELGGRCRDHPVRLELDGGPSADLMWGEAHDDTVRGGGGEDIEYGCAGNDRVLGEAGDDFALWGRQGGDHLKGGAGEDSAFGGRGLDYCRAETKAGCEK